MTQIDLIVILAGAVLWAMVSTAKSPRSISVLVGFAIAYVLAGVATSGLVRFLGQATVVWVYIVIALRYPLAMSGNSLQDARIDRTLRSVRVSVAAARESIIASASNPAARRQAADACELALRRLDKLPAEHPRWGRTIQLVRQYVAALRDAAQAPPRMPLLPSDATAGAMSQLVLDIDREWRAAIRA